MIKRNSSKITDSFVNSAHNEHYNVTKAIHDDVPLTDNTSVIRSTNFEADKDGSYVLRKPLVLKDKLRTNIGTASSGFTTDRYFLSNKQDKLRITSKRRFRITTKTLDIVSEDGTVCDIILKFYDNYLKEHEVVFENEEIPLDWISEINDVFTTSDHTLLNVVINHTKFIQQIFKRTPSTWSTAVSYEDGQVLINVINRSLGITVDMVTQSEALPDDFVFDEEVVELPNVLITLTDSTHTETISVPLNFDDAILSDNHVHLITGTYIELLSSDWDLNTLTATIQDLEAPKLMIHSSPDSMLVNDVWTDGNGFNNSDAFGNDLHRFINISKHESLNNTYVLTIVNPEINTITSNTDVGNAETLDINLLLENPYAIRDLYGYGYVGCTKIVPYVYTKDDSNKTLSNFNNTKIWELTERNFLNSDKQELNNSFKILVSSNPKVFNKKFLFLKAFLTTAVTSSKYYCCWEQSKDGGITWEECPEFVSKFTGQTVDKLVSDLTSADFDKMMYEDSLERASSYLVSKKLVRLNLQDNDFSFNDTIQNRPDVLVLTNPNLSYKYRFSIYLDTERETPVPEASTFTATKTGFTDPSEGFLDNLGSKIKYTTTQHAATTAPTVDDGKLILYEATGTASGDFSARNPKRYEIGSSLTISSLDSNYKIKNVIITLARKTLISGTTDYERLGAAIGVVDKSGTSCPPPWNGYSSGDINPYGMNEVSMTSFAGGTMNEIFYNAKNLWVSEGSSKTYTAASYGTDGAINLSFVNLTRCLMNFNDGIDLAEVSGSNDITRSRLVIESITITYTVNSSVQFTSVYLASTTGTFSVSYSDNTETVEDLSIERDRLFNGTLYYNENQRQLISFYDKYVYSSGTDSAIMKLLNSLVLPEQVTKIVPWRGYLLLFSPRNIYLAKYDYNSDAYVVKNLSNTVGVPEIDADTIVPILNSVYFKSGNKIYKLVPNLYAASDDILNIHQISTGVNTILEHILNNYIESHNFNYADSDTYSVFIPIDSESVTYCITYDFNNKLWTMQKYPVLLRGVESISNLEVYVRDSKRNIYHFRESLNTLLSEGLKQYCDDNGESIDNYSLSLFTNGVPYADYLNKKPDEIIELVLDNASGSYETVFSNVATPIQFEIDFGQKSSNYTLDKQFLESKFVFATLSAKDTIPVTLDIYTDGISRELHWDANTDGAIWKSSLDDVGILNTGFGVDGQDYNGILRQLIVKYSGRGKSIRHVITGESKSLFKFYSMDVRGRILPKKR